MGKLQDLLDSVVGKKKEPPFIQIGIHYEEVIVRMRRSDDGKVILQKLDGDETTVLPYNIWVYGGQNCPQFFILGIDDTWDENEECKVTGVTENLEYYIQVSSWVPNPNAVLPDRLTESGPPPEVIIREKYYMKQLETTTKFIDFHGQNFACKTSDVNNGGVQLVKDHWYIVEITRQWAGADVTVLSIEDSVPTVAGFIESLTI